MSETKLSFSEWLHEVDICAQRFFGGEWKGDPYTVATGFECWRDMYDDGYSPADAWGEEVSCMDE